MSILLIDNYDSFSYNLYQMIGAITPDIRMIRNDEITVSGIKALSPEKIILSPGPGRPENAGVTLNVVKQLGADVPILGVCLGHQAICQAFGASITYADRPIHGKTSPVFLDTDCLLFKGIPQVTDAGLYHSLIVSPDTLPNSLYITAYTKEKEIMAVKHRTYPIYGVQFHPESILTRYGQTMLRNFIALHS